MFLTTFSVRCSDSKVEDCFALADSAAEPEAAVRNAETAGWLIKGQKAYCPNCRKALIGESVQKSEPGNLKPLFFDTSLDVDYETHWDAVKFGDLLDQGFLDLNSFEGNQMRRLLTSENYDVEETVKKIGRAARTVVSGIAYNNILESCGMFLRWEPEQLKAEMISLERHLVGKIFDTETAEMRITLGEIKMCIAVQEGLGRRCVLPTHRLEKVCS
jgi:hypothetical protein